MLMEIVKRWANHKLIIRRLPHLFGYLERCRFPMKRLELPSRNDIKSLHETGMISFHDVVCKEVNRKVTDDITTLIYKEREGHQIDRALSKNVIGIFVEIEMGQMGSYERDFEGYMLQDTAAYYSRNASYCIRQDSCPVYMLKSEECLEKEKDRVSHILHMLSGESST